MSTTAPEPTPGADATDPVTARVRDAVNRVQLLDDGDLSSHVATYENAQEALRAALAGPSPSGGLAVGGS